MSLDVLFLTRYATLGASSRMRAYQFFPALRAAGMTLRVQPLIDDDALRGKYLRGSYPGLGLLGMYLRRLGALIRPRSSRLTWVEKESLPWFPAWLERALLAGRPYVLDFDDAVFHTYDRHRQAWVRRLLGRRIDRLMAGATLVVAGNDYLAERARQAGATWVEVLPTVVDLSRYAPALPSSPPTSGGPLRVVWIGSPSTAQYLGLVAPALARLQQRVPSVLRIIGAGQVELQGVTVECLDWHADTEAALLRDCHVGIMPLHDSPWERGKCAYKLIQYMASGLPTVASAVGANVEVVQDGRTGYLVSSTEQWVQCLERLLTDAPLRHSLGQAGLARVRERYCLQVAAPKLAGWLERAAGRPTCAA